MSAAKRQKKKTSKQDMSVNVSAKYLRVCWVKYSRAAGILIKQVNGIVN